MIAVDSSIVIAGFAAWHESHAAARDALARGPRLIAHAAVETFSVLTRLPPPHRAGAELVHRFLTERFDQPWLTLSEAGYQELLAAVAVGKISGGQCYDALIGCTAAEHGATLISLDRRAAVTYGTVGADAEPLVAARE